MKATIVAAAAVLAVACGGSEKPAAPPSAAKPLPVRPPAVEQLTPPSGDGAAEPFLFATRDGGVLMSWLEPVPGSVHVALRTSRYKDGTWSAPRSVIEREDLFVNWADFPSVVEDQAGTLFAHWLQKSGNDTYAYDVRMATSTDGGATWGEPFLLNRDGRESEHGFVSLVPLPGSGVGAAWLDGRNMQPGHGQDEEMTGNMTLRYATVDARGTVSADTQIDDRTCECCTTGMAMTPGGPLVVYRDRSPDEIRDISFSKLSAGRWSAPKAIREDGWKIEGCPVNGPQADAIGDRVAVAWFTAAGDKGRAFVAFSDDGGSTFGTPLEIDEGKPIGRVDVAMLDADSALVTWLEQTGEGGEIRARRVRHDGTAEPSEKIADASTARAAGFARIARSGGEVFFAWTEQSATTKRIHVARKRFPG